MEGSPSEKVLSFPLLCILTVSFIVTGPLILGFGVSFSILLGEEESNGPETDN